MKRDFKSISGTVYDAIVVGGGIVGAGIARDLSLRGLGVLLLEKEDFGSGTTSRSTRLVHGGLRYMAQLEFGLVRQDLSERELLLRIAPHLVHPLPFLIPVHSTFLNVEMALGTTLYDVLSYDKTLPNHKFYSKNRTQELEPGLKVPNLQGSYLYYDCQIPLTERLNFETALSAYEHGANVINHAMVINVLRDGSRINGVEVKDEISGEGLQTQGRIIVNAAGHWVDSVKNMVFNNRPAYLRRTKGAHILIPQVSKHAMVLFSPVDGRLFFIIPWQGYSLVGTTDTDYQDNLDAVYATRDDVNYILEGLHLAYPDVKTDDIYYTYAGLRSLAIKPGKSASNTSRNHELIDHSRRDNIDGMVSVLGGKITAYRAVARDAADLVCRKLGVKARCTTGEKPLPGAPALGKEQIERLAGEASVEAAAADNLAGIYGSRTMEVLSLSDNDPAGKLPISPGGPDIIAQIWHAVNKESCLTISDFMLRRSLVGLRKDQGMDAVNIVAREMKKMLNWSIEEETRQIDEYNLAATLGQLFRAQ
ncbi:MAG: glycerol-3-phosphate dehydrogenase/oxidase [Dehalococcoidia bacterium]|nr:glycerol-3-phosphate dehydrogenase/oxidase [Dehalococcoidia bacterium]